MERTGILANAFRSRVILVVVAFAALSVLVAAPCAAARPGGKLVPASGALLGAWVKTSTSWTQQGVRDVEAMIGRRLDIDHRYYGWSTAFPSGDETWDLSKGRIPMITWEPWGTTLDQIRYGKYDSMLRDRANASKNLGKQFFLRFAYEMNGNWFPWDGYHNNDPGKTNGPAKFISAWRHVHDIFTNAGATNVVWVWCPNDDSVPHYAWNDLQNYYPGDAYVDWVCLDGYNWGTTQWWSHWRSLATIVSSFYSMYASKKPIMVGETASTEVGGNKAQWIRDAENALKSQFPSIAAFLWFDQSKETDWRINSSSTALSAFKELANDRYFKTRSPVNTSRPTISGSASVGSSLSASNGVWAGLLPMTFTYQWRRCDSLGSNCYAISGATASRYVLTSSDRNHTLRVTVTATNIAGQAAATSASTSVVR
ncbi:MAG: hypothetical protein LC808_26475 [Actinobacteria bacterium]|nr:hypothetical protein [Actinomycetota bacterium]